MNRLAESLVLGLALLTAACGRAAPSREAATPSPSPAERDREAVFAAVLIYQAWQFTDEDGPEMAICLAVAEPEGAVDPSQSLLERVRDKVDVLPVSQCKSDRNGVTTADGRTAMVLGVGPVNWLADDDALVRGRYFRMAAASASPLYRVVLEQGRWRCLGPVVEGVPL